TEIEIEAGGGEQDVELRLETGTARVTGRVTDLGGQPVAGLEVEASFNFTANGLAIGFGNGRNKAKTDADGRYALEGLFAGQYSLQIHTEQSATPCAAPRYPTVDAVSGVDARMDFVVGPCFTLEGHVEGLDSFDGLELQAKDPNTDAYCGSGRVAADGSF